MQSTESGLSTISLFNYNLNGFFCKNCIKYYPVKECKRLRTPKRHGIIHKCPSSNFAGNKFDGTDTDGTVTDGTEPDSADNDETGTDEVEPGDTDADESASDGTEPVGIDAAGTATNGTESDGPDTDGTGTDEVEPGDTTADVSEPVGTDADESSNYENELNETNAAEAHGGDTTIYSGGADNGCFGFHSGDRDDEILAGDFQIGNYETVGDTSSDDLDHMSTFNAFSSNSPSSMDQSPCSSKQSISMTPFMSDEAEMELLDLELQLSKESWTNDNMSDEDDQEEEEDRDFDFDMEFQQFSQPQECSLKYSNRFIVDGDDLEIQFKCLKKCKTQIEVVEHAQTCPLRYKTKFSQSNPGLLAKLAWENAISDGYADYLFHEIQKSLLSKRKISNLNVDEHVTTVKNVRLVKSPNFRDYFIIHKEPWHNKRKNRDECEITEDVFRKLIPTSSPIKQYGDTNKALRQANFKTPEKIREKITNQRKKLESYLKEIQLEGLDPKELNRI